MFPHTPHVEAVALLTAVRILDGHNDALLALRRAGAGPEGFLDGGVTEHLDLPRARAGGFAGGFFAVYVPGDAALEELVVERPGGWEIPPMAALDPDYAHRFAEAQIELLFAIEAASDGASASCAPRRSSRRASRARRSARSCTSRAPSRSTPSSAGSSRSTSGACARSARSGAAPNAFGEGVPFRFPSSPDTGPGLTDGGPGARPRAATSSGSRSTSPT